MTLKSVFEFPTVEQLSALVNESEADDNIKAGGITGFMAGCIAQMITKCHSRGEEFKKKWNESYGVKDEKKGAINPALVTINLKNEKEVKKNES